MLKLEDVTVSSDDSKQDAHIPHQEAEDVIIFSVTSWGAQNLQTAGSCAYSDASSMMTQNKQKQNSENRRKMV